MLALPAGVLAVHQLRYLLAYGSRAGHELHAHGDTYLGTAVPLVALLLVVGSSAALVRFAKAWRRREDRDLGQRPWSLIWVRTTLLLLAGFCALELLESLVEANRPGVGVIFSDGGWWAVPAAAAVAALVTLTVRGGRALLFVVAATRRIRVDASPSGAARVWPDRRARCPVLAGCAAGRAPPLRA